MSGYLGSFAIDDTCTFYANTHTPPTGAAVDADAVPGYRVYEDETGTPILTGSMALLDDTNTVGFYSEQITLSAANGFELGKSYCIRITLVVGAVTGIQLQTLQVGAKVDVRMLGGVVQSATDLKDFADDGYDPATNKVQGVVLTDTVTTYTGNTPQTGNTYALASGASGFAAIKAVVDALATTIGAAGAGLTATASAVWAVATRILTAGTNIALAKGTGVTGFNDLDAAGMRTAVGLASANLDTQLGTIDDYLDTEIAAIKAVTDLLPNAGALTALASQASITTLAGFIDTEVAAILAAVDTEIASMGTDLLDLPNGVETGLTLRQALRLISAACAGKASGLATTIAIYRNAVADTKNRITATVDADGNRSAITYDLT